MSTRRNQRTYNEVVSPEFLARVINGPVFRRMLEEALRLTRESGNEAEFRIDKVPGRRLILPGDVYLRSPHSTEVHPEHDRVIRENIQAFKGLMNERSSLTEEEFGERLRVHVEKASKNERKYRLQREVFVPVTPEGQGEREVRGYSDARPFIDVHTHPPDPHYKKFDKASEVKLLKALFGEESKDINLEGIANVLQVTKGLAGIIPSYDDLECAVDYPRNASFRYSRGNLEEIGIVAGLDEETKQPAVAVYQAIPGLKRIPVDEETYYEEFGKIWGICDKATIKRFGDMGFNFLRAYYPLNEKALKGLKRFSGRGEMEERQE